MLTRSRLAVLGSPIAHSLSPLLHRTAYATMGRDWEYDRIEMTERDLPAFLRTRDSSWRGLSLTMPLKGVAYEASSTRDDDARATGAVNTLRFEDDGSLSGVNTDVQGIVRAVSAAGVPRPKSVLILGGGATAASALVAAARLGVDRVEAAARSVERAAHLITLSERLGLELSLRPFAADVAPLSSELVISTLPGGLPAPEWYASEDARHTLLLDVAYSPWPSALAQDWDSAGGRVLSGRSMLVHQALIQIRVFEFGDPHSTLPDEQRVLLSMLSAIGLPADGLESGSNG